MLSFSFGHSDDIIYKSWEKLLNQAALKNHKEIAIIYICCTIIKDAIPMR